MSRRAEVAVLAWRLCREPYADLNGEGARLYGGRWNTPGRPLVYAASTAALAVLEVRVHLDLPPELLPDDYVLMTVDLGDLAVEDVPDIPGQSTRLRRCLASGEADASLAGAVRDCAGGQQCSRESLVIRRQRVPASSGGAGSRLTVDYGFRCEID